MDKLTLAALEATLALYRDPDAAMRAIPTLALLGAHVDVVRARAERAGVALREGDIDAICSDHTPVDDDAKQLPFAESEPGATGLELLLPLTLKWAMAEGLDLAGALAKISLEPARVLGLEAGHLSIGQRADMCIFDPAQHWKVDRHSLRSQGKNTPFLGIELVGKVHYTLVEGHVVFGGEDKHV